MNTPVPARRWFGLIALFMGAGVISAAAATLSPTAAPVLWQPAEFRLGDGPRADNPFDPEIIAVDASFVAPSGRRMVVPAFWYQDYRRELVSGKEVLTAVGVPEWRVRFTPAEPGEYRVTVTASHNRGIPETIAEQQFSVAPAAATARGWVKIAPDRRNFATTDGRMLRLVGENVCWPHERGTFDYDDWFEAMRRSGQNFARLWLAPWWAPLEHVPGTLTHYRLDAAWQIDEVFRAAERRGIYLVLCFDHHGMFQVGNANWGGSNNFWKSNPYNAALGGPCATPNDFFALPRAREIYEKRVRYLIARYGYSPNLLAWQLMNEIDNVFGPLKPADVVAWHAEIARWLHAHDPFGHLVTTSLTGGSDRPEFWKLPEMDFSVYHSYGDAAPARHLAKLAQSYEERYGKPMLVGEFGTSAHDWNAAADPLLRGLRQGLWGGALGGSAGTAMSWWWEDIHSANAYPLWAHLSEILRLAGWPEGEWTPMTFGPGGEAPDTVAAADAKAVPFDAEIPLGGGFRSAAGGVLAVASPLAASRGAEKLNHYLIAPKGEQPPRTVRLNAWFAPHAKVIAHVNSVSADAELVFRVDRQEIWRVPLQDRDEKSSVSKEYDEDIPCDVPEGQHEIELSNIGKDWIYLDRLRVVRVRPASMPGGWSYHPEAIGLRQQDRGVIYVVSPGTVYPAGALNRNPPPVSGQSITIEKWAEPDVEARWYNPTTGAFVGKTRARASGGTLVLPLPDFADDLVGVLGPPSGKP